MQKNSEKIFSEIEVDPVTGDYYVTVPEVILNEMQWYEGTTVSYTHLTLPTILRV